MKINFSGHPVAGFDVAPFVGANLPTDGAALAAVVRETVLALPERESLLQGARLEVILPGLAHAAAVVLAELHGQLGHWPAIRWAVRGAEGFSWPDEATLNLDDVRESARTAR
jgi:hypothetical protein